MLIDSYAFDEWPSAARARCGRFPGHARGGGGPLRGWLPDAVAKRAFTADEVEAYVRPWRTDPQALIRAISACGRR